MERRAFLKAVTAIPFGTALAHSKEVKHKSNRNLKTTVPPHRPDSFVSESIAGVIMGTAADAESRCGLKPEKILLGKDAYWALYLALQEMGDFCAEPTGSWKPSASFMFWNYRVERRQIVGEGGVERPWTCVMETAGRNIFYSISFCQELERDLYRIKFITEVPTGR